MALEGTIRDWLAEHLQEIEAGLTLVGKEFPLPNSLGSKGFIDILAKDRYELLTIVEVKRSENTARQAIHELIKYMALLRNERGVGDQGVRCILASTHWEELEVPFSDFASRANCAVDGFLVSLDADGNPCGVSPRPKAAPGSSLKISPHHMAYLFEDRDRLTHAVPQLLDAMPSVGIESGVAVELECTRGPAAGQFALYVALADIDPDARQEYEATIYANGDCQSGEGIDESTLSGYIYDSISQRTTRVWDGVEIGYPDKFRVIRESWDVLAVHRSGRLDRKPLLQNDEELLKLVAAVGGGSETLLRKLTSPRLGSAWKETLRSAHYCLLGNSVWDAALGWFADHISETDVNAEVEIHIYNPMNMLLSLWKCADGDDRYVPTMSLAAKHGTTLTLLHCLPVWDGATLPENAVDMAQEAYGDELGLFVAMNFHSTWEHEELLTQRLGLKYAVAEWVFTEEGENANGHWLTFSEGGVGRVPIDDTSDRPLGDFLESNERFLGEVRAFFEANTFTPE